MSLAGELGCVDDVAQGVGNSIQIVKQGQGLVVTPGQGYASVACRSLAPAGMPLRLATYVPEKKGGNPGRVALWHIAPGAEPAAVRSKSIGMAEDVELKWSPTGSGLLVRSPPARKAAVVAPEAGSSPAPPPHPARKPPSTSAA